uniref:Uncharacterized protein n=1 Tax=Panagrolaimus sp. PS1159 TaxID=55785 RepID=A0AC35FC31_9BILA
MTQLITVTLLILVIVCTIECYPTYVISSSSESQYERHPLKIPYSASSATTYRLTIPDSVNSDSVNSGFATSEEEARRKRQISSFGEESVDDTLARLDLICNKLKKRSTSNHPSRRSRDTEQLLSFLCKSMTLDDPDLS